MSDERRETAWAEYHQQCRYHGVLTPPGQKAVYEAGYDARNAEVATYKGGMECADERADAAIARVARLEAVLRKAREALDDDASIVARLIELLPARKRDWASGSIAGPCQTNIREALTEIDAVLDAS